MLKLICSLMPAEDYTYVNIKELAKVFGDKFVHTPGFDEYSIVSNRPLPDEYIENIYQALIEFNNMVDEFDKNDWDNDEIIFKVIEKQGMGGIAQGKFMLFIEEDEDETEYEITVPQRDKLFPTLGIR